MVDLPAEINGLHLYLGIPCELFRCWLDCARVGSITRSRCSVTPTGFDLFIRTARRLPTSHAANYTMFTVPIEKEVFTPPYSTPH